MSNASENPRPDEDFDADQAAFEESLRRLDERNHTPDAMPDQEGLDIGDDDTVDLPMPPFRTPAEWKATYDRLPRLLAAIHNIDVAMDQVYANEPADDAPAEVNAAFEEAADQIVDDERKARDALISWFASFTDRPAAIILPDGRVIAMTLEADGLVIVNAENVHRLS